jgi:hypothetical protein
MRLGGGGPDLPTLRSRYPILASLLADGELKLWFDGKLIVNGIRIPTEAYATMIDNRNRCIDTTTKGTPGNAECRAIALLLKAQTDPNWIRGEAGM